MISSPKKRLFAIISQHRLADSPTFSRCCHAKDHQRLCSQSAHIKGVHGTTADSLSKRNGFPAVWGGKITRLEPRFSPKVTNPTGWTKIRTRVINADPPRHTASITSVSALSPQRQIAGLKLDDLDDWPDCHFLPFRGTQQLSRILLHVQCQKNTESSPENWNVVETIHHQSQGWRWCIFLDVFWKTHKVHTVLDAAASPSLNAPASPSLALALGKDLAGCRKSKWNQNQLRQVKCS